MNRLMGNMFYQIRTDKGLSQEEVARTFGVTQQAISDSLQRVLAKLKNFLEEKYAKKV